MSEITEGLDVVEDLWDVLKTLVTHSSMADEIKTAAHKIIDEDREDTLTAAVVPAKGPEPEPEPEADPGPAAPTGPIHQGM